MSSKVKLPLLVHIVLTDDLRLVAELLIGRYKDPQKQESCSCKTTNLRDCVKQVERYSLIRLDLLTNRDEYVLNGVCLAS
jgi:hypothetical protein